MKKIFNNITLFIVSVIILVIQLVVYKIKLVSYNVCNLKTCVCDIHSIKYNYTPSTTHQVLSIIFIVLAILLVLFSIILLFRKKDNKADLVYRIIFAIFTIIVCGVILNNYRLDTKYNTKVQGQNQVLEHYGQNAYLKDKCDGGK